MALTVGTVIIIGCRADLNLMLQGHNECLCGAFVVLNGLSRREQEQNVVQLLYWLRSSLRDFTLSILLLLGVDQ